MHAGGTGGDVNPAALAQETWGLRQINQQACAARLVSERCNVATRGDVERELEHLREQNRLLRDAARFFGDLSERLNAQLQQERARHRQIQAPAVTAADMSARPRARATR
jgi:hypothetical protein